MMELTRFRIKFPPRTILTLLSQNWLLFPLVVLAFLPTFSNGFLLDWDDSWQVLENPLVLNPSLQDIGYHFTHFWQGQYSPVNSLFYLAIHRAFGLEASALHTACLLVHVLSSYLVFGISRAVVSRLLPGRSRASSSKYALVTALVFAIHPVQVESVAWISASKILLYGFFTLLALWTYLRYLYSRHWAWLFLTALAFALGFGAKEQAIILPLNLILFDCVFGRYAGLRWKKLFRSRVLLEKIPFFLMALGFLYFSWINNLGTINPGGYPFYQRLAFGLYSIIEYIFRFLAPVKLYFYHPFPISPGQALPLVVYGYFVMAVILAYFVVEKARRGNRLVLIGFLFFFVNLLLVLHLIPLPLPIITADRYLYLSVIGLAWMSAGCLDDWLRNSKKITRALLLAAGVIWLFLLGTQSHLRTRDWKDSDTIKSNVRELIEKNTESGEIDPIFNLPTS